jgi:peptidoglycan/xylan/chitin deacetylase (PgdA/CDA1 family)
MRARTGLPALAVVAVLLGACSDAAIVGTTHPGRSTAASTTAIARRLTATTTTTTTTPGLVANHGSGPATTLASSTYCPAARRPQFYAPAIPGAGKTGALTFDDGPGPSTAAILGILESYGVRATFSNVGKQEVAWPQEVRTEARAGFPVGNHTWNHKDIVKLSRSNQVAELDRVTSTWRRG